MSEALSVDFDSLPAPICDFCSEPITDDEAPCPALDDGRCSP